jgi:hypothetical protein
MVNFMSLHKYHRNKFIEYEAYEDENEPDSYQEWEDEFGDNISKAEKHNLIRKKIEDRLEQKKIRHELDDYDEEIFKEFEWDDDK